MEMCFWKKFQSRPSLPCLVPSLLPMEVNLTKPECKGVMDEARQLAELKTVLKENSSGTKLLEDCDCPRRCNATEYRISADPSVTIRGRDEEKVSDGLARLYFSFPSNRVRPSSVSPPLGIRFRPSRGNNGFVWNGLQVPHLLEQEKVTLLDLLSNIGGIVGICLGVSLVTVFDIIEDVCSRIRCKLFQPGNEVNHESRD